MSRALALPRSLAAPSMNSCMARPTFHLFSSPLCLGKPSCGQKADVEKQQIYGPQHEASFIQSTITNLKELRHCQPISATETVYLPATLEKVHLTWPCPAKGAGALEHTRQVSSATRVHVCFSFGGHVSSAARVRLSVCAYLAETVRSSGQCCASALGQVRDFMKHLTSCMKLQHN